MLEFNQFRLYQTGVSSEIVKNIIETKNMILQTFTNQNKQCDICEFLERIYENGVPTDLFANIARLFVVISNETIPQLIEALEFSIETRIPSIGALIEIAGSMLNSHQDIPTSKTLEADLQLIETVQNICDNLGHFDIDIEALVDEKGDIKVTTIAPIVGKISHSISLGSDYDKDDYDMKFGEDIFHIKFDSNNSIEIELPEKINGSLIVTRNVVLNRV